MLPRMSTSIRVRTRAPNIWRVSILSSAVAALAAVVFTSAPVLAAPPLPSFSVPPEGYAALDSQSTCDPTAKPGVVDFRDMVLAAYPGTSDLGIIRACDVGDTSEHKEGRAWDWGVSAASQANVAADMLGCPSSI